MFGMKITILERTVDTHFVMHVGCSYDEITSEVYDRFITDIQTQYPMVRRMSYDHFFWPHDMYEDALQFITYANLKYHIQEWTLATEIVYSVKVNEQVWRQIRDKLVSVHGKSMLISWVCRREHGFSFRQMDYGSEYFIDFDDEQSK